MKKIYLLPVALIITCLLSCGKGGTSPSSTNNNNSNNNISTSYVVSTIAGGSADNSAPDGTGNKAGFYSPQGITVDASGNLYVTDEHRIRKITQAGVVTTFAGSTTALTYGYADGTGTNALFNYVQGITSDGAGNLYVCDRSNYRIRKITPAGVVSTIAGNGTAAVRDGTGTSAEFFSPRAITIDASGNLYVLDGSIYLRKITPSGVVSTLYTAGNFIGMVADASGSNIYATTSSAVVKIALPAVSVSVFAGNSSSIGYADGAGTAALFYPLQGIASDATANLYVCDPGNYRIRKITSTGTVTTFAGMGTLGIPTSVDGPISSAQFQSPNAIVIDASGNIFVLDWGWIRKISKQ